MASRNLVRIGTALTLGSLLLISPPAISGGFVWDVGIAGGYVAVVLVIFLYVYPLRGDGLPHSRLLGLSQHRRIGWWMLWAAVAHAVILISAQPWITRYLVPSAPLFMWAGVAAMIASVVLVQTGLAARSAMRRSQTSLAIPPKSATLHIVLAAALMLTLWAHIVGSAQIISGANKAAALCCLFVLPLAWFAFRPRSRRSHQSIARRAACGFAAVIIPLLLSSTARSVLLEPAVTPNTIPLLFPHEKHVSVNCITCHHNFVDHTGVAGCIDCHRGRRADLHRSSEATFHIFCRECHADLALDGAHHGPTRVCSGCHQN